MDRNKLLIGKEYSNWEIVIGDSASESEIHAANELQHFLDEILDTTLAIISDEGEPTDHQIIIGQNSYLEKMEIVISFKELGNEGFIIKNHNNSLVIAGGRPRGTLYGVYTFLEDYAGCRWLSSKVSKIPKKDNINIYGIDDMQIPVLEYRDPHYFDAFDGDWAARNKMNGYRQKSQKKHGGKISFARFVHTFKYLVPEEEYFDCHPEYFSEVNGKRLFVKPQLCLTNPDVLEISIKKVKEWLEEAPEATIVSVSQNDWLNPCQCKDCSAVDEKEGSHSGTLIHFVNKIAEAIEDDYPHVAIETLAYQYTRKPPKYVRPRKNVIVRLCSIECCVAHPLETCDEIGYRFADKAEPGASFARDLEGWGKISERLYIWDYVTNFFHYLIPFPNFQVLQPNIKFFIKNNVKGILEQGMYEDGGGGEFAELRAYVIAKLLWNPDYNVNLAINEFMVGYYGMAAPAIRQYFDMIHKKIIDDDLHLSIYDPAINDYLTPEIIDKANNLFDKAEILADNEEVLERVRRARLPVRFAELALMEEGTIGRVQLIEKFFDDIEKLGITKITEFVALEICKEMLTRRLGLNKITDEFLNKHLKGRVRL